MKRWASLLLAIVCAGSLAQSTAAAANSEISITINGVPQTFDQPPILVNGMTLVPMRGIFEALGAKMEWDEGTSTAIGRKDGKVVITLHNHSKLATVSGQQVELEAEAQLINNTMMVPVRLVSETLGMLVNWNEAARTIQILNDEEMYGKTKRQIINRIHEAQPVYSGEPFVEPPQISSPQKAGKLQSEFIEDGVRMANLMRYLAGLPDDLEPHAELNENAQYGAVLLADVGKLSHTPAKPADMGGSFYDKGYASTSTSNIYNLYGTGNAVKPNAFLARTVISYMRDEDDFNIAVVGHRRWILNPPLKEVGFGFAEGNAANGYKSYFSPMQVFDRSRSGQVDYETVAWPAKGYFPTRYFQGNDPWSLSLNPNKFMLPSLDTVSVKLVRWSDQRVWTMDKNNHKLQKGADYFNVDTNGYGIPNCIVFRPGDILNYKEGDRYEVTVSGLEDKQGNAVQLTYPVVFFESS